MIGRHISYARALSSVTEEQEKGEMRVMENGLTIMSLRSFISRWGRELEDYYDESFGTHEDMITDDSSFGDTMIFVLVDNYENVDVSYVPPDIRKKIKKAGKWRRDKLRHQWSYINPLNRIHGFLVMNEVTNIQRKKRTMCIDTICSTYFTKKKGIGSDLMKIAIDFSKELGAFDIVLQLSNEYSAIGFPDSDDEDSDDEEDSDSDDEEDSDEEDSDEEVWYPDDSVLKILTEELWKKCMRKGKDGKSSPYYNLSQDYIKAGLWNYFHCCTNSEEESELWEGTEKISISNDDDIKDNEYGGFWYQKGKRSQSSLIRFYEKFGFQEDKEVYTDWCIFDHIPYPTFRLSI